MHPMAKPKILVTRKLPDAVEARLAQNYDATFNPNDIPMNAAELLVAMQDFDALVPTVSDLFDSRVLRVEERSVRMIANVGVGYSNIDTETAQGAGISVSNTPDVLTDATADIAILLILSATRRAYAGPLDRCERERRVQWHARGDAMDDRERGRHNSYNRFGRCQNGL